MSMSTKNDLRIVLIGAGSVSFGLATMGDLMTVGMDRLQGSTIVFHDLDPNALRRTTGVFKMAMEEYAKESNEPIPYKIESTTDPNVALKDANYCVMSIEHGNRMKTWAEDYYVPRKLGCIQIYGENGGPGGAFHTWRQVPPMLEICKKMEDMCPKAWMLNYSNPVPRITLALSKATKIKVVGLCHGISSGIAAVSAILGTQVNDFDFTSVGTNHFFWMIKVTAKNAFTMRKYGPHPEVNVTPGTDLTPYIRSRGVTWAQERELPLIEELLTTFGYMTYPGQSHPGEFLHFADKYCPSSKYDFKEFQRSGDEMKAKCDRTLEGKENNYWWQKFSNERAIPIIDEIEHDLRAHEHAVNILNNGCVSNMPDDCVVEIPATVDAQGIHGQKIGRLPQGVAQLCQQQASIQQLVADAAITGDYTTAIQALSVDPMVPSPRVARALFDEMLNLQAHLLPQFAKSH